MLPPSPFKDCSKPTRCWKRLASAIVRAGAASSSVGNSDVVDLSAEMVALMSARTLFDAKPRDAKNRERSAKHPDRGNHLRPNLQHQTQRAHHHTWQAFS